MRPCLLRVLLKRGRASSSGSKVVLYAGLYVMPKVVEEENYADWYKFYQQPGPKFETSLTSGMSRKNSGFRNSNMSLVSKK